jgi:hypothetical protein
MVLVRCILYEVDGDDAVGLFLCPGRLKQDGKFLETHDFLIKYPKGA